MITLFILFLLCTIILYNNSKFLETYTCGVTDIDERAIGLKKIIFKPRETVYLNINGSNSDKKEIYNVLQKYAFPYINLNFKLGNKKPSITFNTNAPAPSASIKGTTLGIGTRSPTINLWTLERGTILHELGHSLGLKHEQTNPSPNNEIQWNELEVIARYKAKNWSESEIYKQILKRDTSNAILYTKWDSKSIMNYSITDPKLTTNSLILYRGTEYSDGDKLWFQIKYGKKR